MVGEIKIYIEGGADGKQAKSKLREGFGDFLDELRQIARNKRIGWTLVACGSRNSAYEDFCTAIKSSPTVFHVLLVDSEDAVTKGSSIWSYLNARDSWDCPPGLDDNRCFLMEQSMETWLIADRKALIDYYGQKFKPNSLPTTSDIESIDKKELMKKLLAATKDCESKGPYHKTRHGFDILAKVRPEVVRKSASHCQRLFSRLSEEMGERIE